MGSETQIAHLLAQPASFTPNFTAEHSVVLPHSLQTVFDRFGSGETLEDSVRLSDLCSTFRLMTKDHVTLSKDQSLGEVRCRGLQASSEPVSSDGERSLVRQFFVLEEVVPLLCGLYQHTVTIAGCLTSDPRAKRGSVRNQRGGRHPRLEAPHVRRACHRVRSTVKSGRKCMSGFKAGHRCLLRSTGRERDAQGPYYSYGAVPTRFSLDVVLRHFDRFEDGSKLPGAFV
ncbi:hypothetical protein B0H14DRAFT_33909 [Mycena olivaceomarginata]|nr:hypothetical protein B0H14DRAFT_33909 [Mycena olivaceomarginata]